MQIAEWLNKLDLGQYSRCFAENGIDISVVRHLSDQDLKEIGVLLGHRRKSLAAIAEVADATTPQTSAVAEWTPREGAERRQVTAMFCDLVGSRLRRIFT